MTINEKETARAERLPNKIQEQTKDTVISFLKI